MKAAVLNGPAMLPAVEHMVRPSAQAFEMVVKVDACALCRTDLHVLDGDLPDPKYPLVLGHEVVGTVVELGERVELFGEGDRVGIPWLASTCLDCSYCRAGKENLCACARFTGYTKNGGFADFMLADSRFCFRIPEKYDSVHAAPLLCAGLIGWRSLKFTGEAQRVGIYGFGAAAHVITPVALSEGRKIFAFTSPGDDKRQQFARELGAAWAGSSDELPPEELDAAIIFAPVGALIPAALKVVARGGTVVCGGIHMSDIPSFGYDLLWGERTVRSVANLTRRDGEEFFHKLANVHVATHVRKFDLDNLNEAIAQFRRGDIHGAAVIVPKLDRKKTGETLMTE